MLRVVRTGYSFPLVSPPPLTGVPIAFPEPSDPSRARALEAEVRDLLTKGAIFPVSNPGPGFYARLFTVPKKNGEFRPILDLSALNEHIQKSPFKMETPPSIRLAIRPGDWATSLDLSDAYFHILVHENVQHLLRFVWSGVVYQFRALPFGLSLAPLIFTKVTRELAALVRAEGVRLKLYLDDWLTLAATQSLCRTHSRLVMDWTSELGFLINHSKSDLHPSQSFVYLGMSFDTVAYTVAPTSARLDALTSRIARLSARRTVTLRHLCQLLGTMESLSPLLPLGRVFKRPLQREVALRSSKPPVYSQVITLGPWFLAAVSQWLDPVWLRTPVPIQPPAPQVFLFTDASKTGWGAHLDLLETSGLWSPQESLLHINLLEMEAVRLSLLQFAPTLRGKSVLLHGDNTVCLAYLKNQGGTHSTSLSLKAEQILLWCFQQNILLSVQFIPGKLNSLADLLSRRDQILPTEWTISHKALLPLWSHWFTPLVDLFATRYSKRLPLYVSPFHDPMAFGKDAFALPWSGLQAYAYPPTALVTRVLAKYAQERPTLLLVAPFWPTAAWFPELVALSHVPPFDLNLDSLSLLQPRSGIPHPAPDSLRLTAWLLCGQNCEH